MPKAYFDEDIGLGELREDDLDALYQFIEGYYLEAPEWWTRLQLLIQDEHGRRTQERMYKSPRGDSGGLSNVPRLRIDPRKLAPRSAEAGYNSILKAVQDLEPRTREWTSAGAQARAMKRCLVKAGNTLYAAVLVWADKEATRRLKKLRANIQSAALN